MLSTIPGQIPANVASECINDLDLQYIFNRDGKKKNITRNNQNSNRKYFQTMQNCSSNHPCRDVMSYLGAWWACFPILLAYGSACIIGW